LIATLEENLALQAAITAKPSHMDGVTAPTGLYDSSIAYYSGEDADLPAVTMTPYAARQYTKWLSVLLGVDYRLPSEAEWEYAARAGAQGNRPDPDDLDSLAWYDDNSDYEAQAVGGKAPNAWGLYDTLGNVAELVLDAPSDDLPDSPQPLSWRAAIAAPKAQYPRIAKGGFYESAAEELRFAQRMLTEDEEWKASDPNSPLSPWWFADDPSCGVGMRIVRPLDPMDQPTRQLAWEIDSSDLREAVEARVKEGRGKLQTINRDLPKVVEQLDSPSLRKLMD
jgi:hypothetical protein